MLPYPEGTSRTTHNFKVIHMFTTSDFGKTPGETETPSVSKTTDGIRFTVTGLSPIAVGWTEIQSGGSSSYRDGEDDFWQQVLKELEKAQSGDTVKANAAGYDRMPPSVMEALDKVDGVTLHITWNGGEDIIIPSSAALKTEVGRVYYPLSYLAEMNFSVTTPQIFNSQTGGLVEVTAPVQENESALTLDEITPPDLGMAIVPELTQPEENVSGNGTASAAASQNNILLWLAAAALLAAAGTGLWLYKRRKAG